VDVWTSHRIEDAAELAQRHRDGVGAIVNVFGWIVHSASCAHVGRMTVGSGKLWFETDTAAMLALSSANRRPKRCPVCLGELPTQRPMPEPPPLRADPESPTSEVVLRARWHIPYGSKDAAKRGVRRRLCDSIRQLEGAPGMVLAGEFAGRRPANADAENLLIYNINEDGAAFSAASRHGIRFELDPCPPSDDLVEYRYRLEHAGASWRHWSEAGDVAHWLPTELVGGLRTKRKADAVWWTVRHSLAATGSCEAEPYAVRVTLGMPVGRSAAALIKPVFDGVISALHEHERTSELTRFAVHLSASLGLSYDAVFHNLVTPSSAPLGRTRIVRAGRAEPGLQWAPADHLCVAGELVIVEDATQGWMLSGRVTRLRATPRPGLRPPPSPA
jgi:hypothetical protein